MITICSCCNQDSAGNHEWGCPCSPKTYPGKQADDVVASLYQRIATLEADLARVTGEIDTYQEMIADLQASVKRVIDERDALSGAMTAEMSGVALAYAAMKTERDRLQRIVDGHELISMRYATLRAALTQCVEALTGLLSQKPAIDGEPHAFWNHNAQSLWVTEYRRGQDALAHAQAVLADK